MGREQGRVARGLLSGLVQPVLAVLTGTGPVVSAADDRRSSVGGARAERGTERDRLHGDFCLPMTRTTQDGECGRGKVQL